jgi:hypothetical protein
VDAVLGGAEGLPRVRGGGLPPPPLGGGGVPGPPYDAAVVAEWVGDMVARGVRSAATSVAGLNKHHVDGGGKPLREHVAIQQALEGWARLKSPPVQKKPFTGNMLLAVEAKAAVHTLVGARDVAMLVVAHGGAFRGESELLAARLPLRLVAGGAEVDVHTKTDKNVHTTSARRIPVAGVPGLPPLRTLQRYLGLSGHTTGLLFRNVSGGGAHARSNDRGVSRSTLSAVVKHWAGELGHDPREFASHSLKHGCAADVKTAGVPTRVAMKVTGHKSLRAYNGYGGEAARRLGAAAQRVQRRAELASSAAENEALETGAWTAHQVPPSRGCFVWL